MTLESGSRLGHYIVGAPLGAGGMGEVYRATDTRLGREVAIKILPASLASNPEMVERFRREARAVAALNHPHIVTIHSVEEIDGLHVLTMELVAGESLDQVLATGVMSAQRILAIATALAEALEAAHGRGIIHRDLKPANVMVTPAGGIKVLDFGLARFRDASSSEHAEDFATVMHTSAGVVMGTGPYMSPEQVQGGDVDHRTDIFSLGVVLHEMATGRRPFDSGSAAGLFASILRDPAPPVTEARPDLPAALADVIQRCLEKDAGRRFQTARDLSGALAHARDAAERSGSGASSSAFVPPSGTAQADEGFWVAVLPFKYTGANADLTALAEGLTEEIVTGLSRFSYLKVIARGTTERFANQVVDVRTVGKDIGARYMMEGSLRQAGTKLRLSVELIDTTTGAHLWAERYERPFSAEALFELQDELVPPIVSTVADTHGVLARSMAGALRSRPPEELTPYEAVLRSFAYFDRVTAEELSAAKSGLEAAIQKAPGYADAWAMLALLTAQDYGQGFGQIADPLASGAAAARRAVEAGPTSHLAHFSLAQVLFFQKEFGTFRNTAERTAALNPMDGNAMAFLGEMLIHAGDSERGLPMATRAKQLNPHHPGWYWYADYIDAYRREDYRAALGFALKVNLPQHWAFHLCLAVAYGQLGEREPAGRAVEHLLRLKPEIARTMRQDGAKWWDARFVEQLIDGLRKAGLDVPAESAAATPSTTATLSSAPRSGTARAPGSGAARADEGFWVAVLPFRHTGPSPELTALADGLTDEILAGLSRFSYLKVIARGSTERFANQVVDVRGVGKEIGARYVLEGSLRQAGSELRVAVQVVDTHSGAHLWAETYRRPFQPDAIFAAQDDLVPRIVSTVADWYGVLPHSMSEAVRSTPPDRLTPYEAVLRSFGYFERIGPEEHAAVRSALERAVAEAPGSADGWAMLSMMYGEEHRFDSNVQPDSLGRSLQAARRAVDAGHGNHFAWLAMAQALFFRKEFDSFRHAAERSIALNPMDGSTVQYLSHLLAFSGDWTRGGELAERSRQLNPNHPGWYWAVQFLDAYRQGDYANARVFIEKGNMPAHFFVQGLRAAVFGQLGDQESAAAAVRQALALKPGFAATARADFAKWYLPDLVEQLIDGLRKAGLDVAEPASSATSSAPAIDRAGASPATPAPATSATPAMAVLPFANMSANKDQDYFSDGLAEEIINLLAHVPGLKVIARTSAFAFRGKEQDVREIGRALGVSSILQGSVRRAGNRLRVTAQLIDAADGDHLWAERFDREMAEVFTVQDEIAAAIVGALKLTLTGQPAAARPYEPNVAAYEALLKGRHHYYRKFSPEAFASAEQAFATAAALDPEWVEPHAALGDLYFFLGFYGWRPLDDMIPRARAEVLRALEIVPSHLMAHAVLGAITALSDYQWQVAERHVLLARSSESLPPHGRFLCALGYLMAVGRFDEALDEMAKAIAQDPVNAFYYSRRAWVLLCAGRTDEAIAEAGRALEFDRASYQPHMMIALALAFQERFAEATVKAEEVFRIASWDSLGTGLLAGLRARAGERDRAAELIPAIQSSGAAPVGMMMYHLIASEIDAALDWYEKDIELRRPNAPMIAAAAFLAPLRASPRWPGIARMMNLPASG
ncbi:MAG: protein kinase domain-containing protein [Acidobacteriota bacterium]